MILNTIQRMNEILRSNVSDHQINSKISAKKTNNRISRETKIIKQTKQKYHCKTS